MDNYLFLIVELHLYYLIVFSEAATAYRVESIFFKNNDGYNYFLFIARNFIL